MANIENPLKNDQQKDSLDAGKLTIIKNHNGFPVISEEDYYRFYNTDARAGQESAEDGLLTFDFRGYVKIPDGNLEYKDALATNGLLKKRGCEGIHVGTDGIKIGDKTKGPEDVDEYVINISIPKTIQKEKKIICKDDSCYSEADYIGKNVEEDENPDQIIEEDRERGGGWLVIRTWLDPKKDPGAREKAQAIHQAVVRHITTGGKLEKIEDLVKKMEDKLLDEFTDEAPPTQRKQIID